MSSHSGAVLAAGTNASRNRSSVLTSSCPVLSLTVEGETRAYPLRVMTWHEIVNDTVGGVPVAVTYCPLCNSGVAFEREIDGRVLSFGTSGMLYADNLVMYDRQTESLWPQLTGEASIGVLTGAELTAIPMGVVAWDDFREANPESLVLSRETGFDRPYGRNPPTVDCSSGSPAAPTSGCPSRSGSSASGTTRTASALDADSVSGGADVGAVGVYVPVVDGRRLHFEAEDGMFRDRETGSRWDILGRATGGELKGTQLEPYRHLDTFWFAWVTFHPDTKLIDLGAAGQ